eukprot:6960049-Ditylum_brightwellii.AAC.1
MAPPPMVLPPVAAPHVAPPMWHVPQQTYMPGDPLPRVPKMHRPMNIPPMPAMHIPHVVPEGHTKMHFF